MEFSVELYETPRGQAVVRGLWFFQYGRRIIVVRCFIKKTQKTPSGDLDLARKRMSEYMSRVEE